MTPPLASRVTKTTLSRFARVAPLQLSAAESHRHVLHLYRKIVRLVPSVLRSYEVEDPSAEALAVANIRRRFVEHQNITNTTVVEVLRHKAEMELQETLLMYKTKCHVYDLVFSHTKLSDSLKAKLVRDQHARDLPTTPQTAFLSEFYQGTA